MASGLDDSGDSMDEEDDDVTQIISDDFAYRKNLFFAWASWARPDLGGQAKLE